MGFVDILKWLLNIRPARSTASPNISRDTADLYANFSRRTRTGMVRARGGQKEEGLPRFGQGKILYISGDLSDEAESVYFYLCRIADKNGYSFPFIQTIADRCGISKYKAAKSLKELQENGLLDKVARRVSRRGGSSTMYRVRLPVDDESPEDD